MQQQLHKHLAPVRTRLTLRRVARAFASALVLAGWVAAIAGLMALVGGAAIMAWAGIAAMILVPVAAALAAWLRPASWQQAARAVDRHFHWEDRIITALYLSGRASNEPLEALQVEDALARLRAVPTRDAAAVAVPWQRLLGGLALCGFAALLIGWSALAPPDSAATVHPSEADDPAHGAAQRTPDEPIAVDPALAQRSLQLSDSVEDAVLRAPPSTLDADLVNRYFDALDSRPPGS